MTWIALNTNTAGRPTETAVSTYDIARIESNGAKGCFFVMKDGKRIYVNASMQEALYALNKAEGVVAEVKDAEKEATGRYYEGGNADIDMVYTGDKQAFAFSKDHNTATITKEGLITMLREAFVAGAQYQAS